MASTISSNIVLVTGGAGYIGSHTCKALARTGYLPVVYDSLCRGNAWAVQWGPLERGDIRDIARLTDVLKAYRPMAVLHFAAFAYVGESVENPSLYYENNVGGTLSLLNAMRAQGVKRLVLSSTCATYGVPGRLPIFEDTPQAPINPYGRSKLMVEQVVQDLAARDKISAVALRYFNAAGADADGEIGESHDPETHLIPLVLEAARSPARPLAVFGKDYPTPDGTCVRDYIHVADLADAHVRALRYLELKEGFTALNLGCGSGHSIKEIITAAERVTGRRVPHVYEARRVGDPPVLVADATLARRTLGWQPQHSDLDNILRTAWNWSCRSSPASGADAARIAGATIV